MPYLISLPKPGTIHCDSGLDVARIHMFLMIIDTGIIAVCCFAALAFGSNMPWAMGIIVAATGVLLAIRIIYDVWSGKLRLYAGWIYLPLILFLGLSGAQAWFWKRPMNATSLWSIHSVDRYSTILYLLLAASYIAIVFIVQNGFRSRRQIKFLLISIVTLGVFESLYGLVQYLGDYDFIWNFEKIADRGLATGTLINRNHYALLMNLIICASVGFLFYRSKRILRMPKLSLRNAIGNPASAKLLWIILIVALMGFALVFSMSRMGIVAMLCSVGVMIAATSAAESGRRWTVIGTLLLAAVLGLAVYTGIDPVLARFEKIGMERRLEQDRVALWRDAWPMMKKNPIFGQGFGSFQWTYPAYEQRLCASGCGSRRRWIAAAFVGCMLPLEDSFKEPAERRSARRRDRTCHNRGADRHFPAGNNRFRALHPGSCSNGCGDCRPEPPGQPLANAAGKTR